MNLLIDFIKTFNKKNISKEIQFSDKTDNDRVQHGFIDYFFKLPSGNQLELRVKALIVENFPPHEGFPTYKNRIIKAFGVFRNSTNKEGYNFILLYEEDNAFGEWFILKNEYRMMHATDFTDYPKKYAFDTEKLMSESRYFESSIHNPKFYFFPFDLKYFYEIFLENIK